MLLKFPRAPKSDGFGSVKWPTESPRIASMTTLPPLPSSKQTNQAQVVTDMVGRAPGAFTVLRYELSIAVSREVQRPKWDVL